MRTWSIQALDPMRRSRSNKKLKQQTQSALRRSSRSASHEEGLGEELSEGLAVD